MQRKDKSKGKGCCKIRGITASIFTLFILIALALGVNASNPAFVAPATSGVLSDGTIINVSMGDGSFITHVIINASSSKTANSSVKMILNITNTTGTNFDANDYANITFNFGSLNVFEDGNNYVFECTTINSSGAYDSCTASTSVVVDRTIPQAPTAVAPVSTANTTTTQAFSATVIGANTTLCQIRFTTTNPGSSVYAMTHSGNSCTLSLANMARGTYNYVIRASDETNFTDSASSQVVITQGASNIGERAYVIATVGGGGSGVGGEVTKEDVGRTLGVLNQDVTTTPIGMDIKNEATQRELIKTGIGTGTGAVIGMVIGTIVLPGIGTIAGAPLGAMVGGFLGFLA
mgnify:FL=1